ncbi:S-adenosyl-L-methionine-dependent methyltransferase [Astrocystis sublimbata]|nr:S-adenosyl-L-methionine-dependent methyltransferase [Astrocystis sublimbata]
MANRRRIERGPAAQAAMPLHATRRHVCNINDIDGEHLRAQSETYIETPLLFFGLQPPPTPNARVPIPHSLRLHPPRDIYHYARYPTCRARRGAATDQPSCGSDAADMDINDLVTHRKADGSSPVDPHLDQDEYDALIEAGGTDEEGEFTPSDYDDESMADSTSSTQIRHVASNHFYHGRGTDMDDARHGRYPIPNDEHEQNREDMLHAMMLEATDGRRFFAPIPHHPTKILDLGTGTGIWAIEMADMFPSAEVLGVDLSPIQPPWIPSNCKFIIDDVEDTWENGRDWDFVHLRNMIPILRDPVQLLKNAYENMKPGAWVELQDVDGNVHCDDGTMPPDWPVLVFTNLMVEAFGKLGTKSHAAAFGAQYLAESGFVNIQHHAVKLPYGTWPRDKTMRLIGLYYRTAAEQFFPAMGNIQLPLLGYQPDEIEGFFALCREAMRDPNVHAYGVMHFWSGQKPLNAS